MHPLNSPPSHIEARARGRLVSCVLPLPAGPTILRVGIAAAYCPVGGTAPGTAYARGFARREREMATAGMAFLDDCRRMGIPAVMGMDANAIGIPADTWSSHAAPRPDSALSRWLGSGPRDTFRELFPDLRIVTHYGAKGGGGSKLDYILSTDPQTLCVVGAAVHVGAVWPFDHLPVLADLWGTVAPASPDPHGFTLRWRQYMTRLEAARANPRNWAAFQERVRAVLPVNAPETGPGDDGVLEHLERNLAHARNPFTRLGEAKGLLDTAVHAVHGLFAHVVSTLEGNPPPPGQRPAGAPKLPAGTVWQHMAFAVRSAQRVADAEGLGSPPLTRALGASPAARIQRAPGHDWRPPLRAVAEEISTLAGAAQELLDADAKLAAGVGPLPRPPPTPLATAPREEWQAWWSPLVAPARGGRAAGSIALLRALLPRVAALTQARGASTRARERRRARRYHDLRRFFAAFKGGAGMGGGLRPTEFLPAAAPGVPPGPPPTRRPCQSDAERREASDQDWAWMHDRQPAFPPPAFLRRVWDPPPAPAVPRWTVDWQQWGDLSGTGWPRLTLWDRVLARALLPPDAPDLPHLRGLLREAGAPLTTGEREWFLRAPAHKAPDPISQFKIRGLEAFPDRFQALAVSLAEVAITRGIAPPAAKPSATVHAPKADGGTRPLGLWAELLKRTEGLAAQRLTRAATPLPPGLLTQGWNVAYTPGASSSDIMGIIRILVEADQLLGLGLVWIMGDYHKWFDAVRREFVEAKLDALGVAPSVCRLVADIYYKQLCRQLTAYGPSPGRFRGPAGLTQGSHGSPLWSLLVQDPLWVLLAEELRVPGRGAQVLGVDIPGMGYSDDWLLVLAKDSALRPILAVFGAACEDLGISCKPKALQVFLRRPLAPGEVAPPVAAWDPFQGEPLVARPRARADTDTTPHLGVPRAPAGAPAPLRARAERKLELGAATLAGYRLR